MFFCIKPPRLRETDTEPGGKWFSTDHIVQVNEVRRRPSDDEPLALEMTMVSGEKISINTANAGRGTAEAVLEWLQTQNTIKPKDMPQTIEPVLSDVDKKKTKAA